MRMGAGGGGGGGATTASTMHTMKACMGTSWAESRRLIYVIEVDRVQAQRPLI